MAQQSSIFAYLVVFKQRLLFAILEVIGVDVRVLEHISRVEQLRCCLSQVFDVVKLFAGGLLDVNNAALYVFEDAFFEAFGAFVVVVACEVEYVPLQLAPCRGTLVFVLLLFLRIRRIKVAFIPVAPMLGPLLLTNPTKVKPTPPARNVVAPLILFDSRLAPRAGFCVREDPVCCFRFVFLLAEPALNHITFCRCVGSLFAGEAEGVPAFAGHDKGAFEAYVFVAAVVDGADRAEQ